MTEHRPGGRRPRRDERKALTRANILTAAETLFRDRGVDATSMAQIAALANTGVGTLYGYFPSKDDLLREIVTRLGSQSISRYLSMTDGPRCHFNRLQTALEVWCDFHAESRSLLRSALGASARPEMAFELAQPMVSSVTLLIEAGIRDGNYRDIPARTAARMLVTTFTSIGLGTNQWPADDDTDASRKEALALVRVLLGVEGDSCRNAACEAHNP